MFLKSLTALRIFLARVRARARYWSRLLTGRCTACGITAVEGVSHRVGCYWCGTGVADWCHQCNRMFRFGAHYGAKLNIGDKFPQYSHQQNRNENEPAS